MSPQKYRSKREEEGPDLGYVIARLVRGVFFGRLLCQAADHRAVQAQIGQFAVRQLGQFVDCLAVDAIPNEPRFDGIDQRSQDSCWCALDCALMCCCSHLRIPIVLVVAGVARRLLEIENR